MQEPETPVAGPRPGDAEQPPGPASSTRSGRSARDIALSIIVLMVPVFLLLALFRFLGNEEPPTIDTAPAYDAARAAGAFPVAEPRDLPDGWLVQSAVYRPGILRVGYRSPDEGALQLVQSSAPPDEVIALTLGQRPSAVGTVEVNGVQWERYTGTREGERALVRKEPGRVVVVVGRATEADLRTIAAALR